MKWRANSFLVVWADLIRTTWKSITSNSYYKNNLSKELMWHNSMINIIGKKYIWIIFSDFFNFFLFKKFIPKPISCQYRFHYVNDVICCFVSWLRLVWDTKDFVWSKSQRSLKLDLHETEIETMNIQIITNYHA